MSLFGQTKRHTPVSKPRRSPLPVFTGEMEKKYDYSAPVSPSGLGKYFTTVYFPIPTSPFGRSSSSESLINGNGISGKSHSHSHSHSHHSHRPRRYVRVCLPIPPRLYARLPKINSRPRFALLVLLALGFLLFLLGIRRKPGGGSTWSPPFSDPDSLVITPDEAASIWQWEVLSGHYPSTHPRESHPLSQTLLQADEHQLRRRCPCLLLSRTPPFRRNSSLLRAPQALSSRIINAPPTRPALSWSVSARNVTSSPSGTRWKRSPGSHPAPRQVRFWTWTASWRNATLGATR